MRRSRLSWCHSWISFVADVNLEETYEIYGHLSNGFPGWSLTEIKSMSPRERLYWLKFLAFKNARS